MIDLFIFSDEIIIKGKRFKVHVSPYADSYPYLPRSWWQKVLIRIGFPERFFKRKQNKEYGRIYMANDELVCSPEIYDKIKKASGNYEQ